MSVQRRSADVRAVLGEHVEGPLTGWFAAVVCNGCGSMVVAPDPAQLAERTQEWQIGAGLGDPDYCPACRP